ncbi:tetratricopeptide repeat protein [Vulgatibacter sp.]|uniref:tetratricopeptide repeat protein n=1 Tax=Vulgatibacter sp. TaxID=1971226 RepID=UPI0035656EB5
MTHRFPLLATLVVVHALLAPVAAVAAEPAAEAPPAQPAAPTPPAPEEDVEARLAALWKEADALYAARHQAGNLDRSDDALATAEKLAAGRYETLWRKSRSLFWRGEIASEDDDRERFAKQGWDVAEEALQAKPGGAEGHYYAAINAGTYGQAIGILKALTQGVEGPFVDHLRVAMKKAPNLDDGGPATAMGRYHYELPWPKYDGEESERILRQVVEKHPRNLRAKLYLAETLLKEGNPQESLALLEAIEATKGSGDPAETQLVRKRAKRLVPKVKDELE